MGNFWHDFIAGFSDSNPTAYQSALATKVVVICYASIPVLFILWRIRFNPVTAVKIWIEFIVDQVRSLYAVRRFGVTMTARRANKRVDHVFKNAAEEMAELSTSSAITAPYFELPTKDRIR